MSLIVEDGSNVAGAESYISVADADAYHSDRGNTAWASLTTEVKEQNLRKAAEYMLQVYRQAWQGQRVYSTQALDWPRAYVVVDTYDIDSDIVPTEIKRACAELALKASSATLAPDVTQSVKRKKVDVIEIEYDQYSPQSKRYRPIDLMLAPYLQNYGGVSMRLARV